MPARADDALDEVTATRERLRDAARRELGVTGDSDTPRLRSVLAENGLSAYPLFALGLLSIVDTFHGFAFGVLSPEIAAALGVGKGAIAAVIALKTLVISLAPLPFAALVQKYPRRALLAVLSAFLWSAVALSTGFVVSIWGLFAVLILDGLTTASVGVLHTPLLMDSYPPSARVRVLSVYQAANSFGNVLAPLLVALLAAALAFTWRGVFIVLGLASLCAAAATMKLRDPGFGRWDTDRVRRSVREDHATESDRLAEDDVALGFFEIVRRLLLIPTVRRLLAGQLVFGILLIPFQTFIAFFLDERWNLGPGARGLFTAYTAGAAVVALLAYGRRGEALFRKDPARLVEVASLCIAAAVVLIGLGGLSPVFAGMVVAFGGAFALIAVLAPALAVAVLSVIPARMRPHAACLLQMATGAGGVAGAVLLGGVDRRFGVVGTMVSLVVPGVLGAVVIRSTGKLIASDLDRMIDETIDDEEIRQLHDQGKHLPMLSCRGVDFSYGQLQVLFGVDFTVDDGEMVALLGTNGAGKSTLLKCISGIGLPSAGSVRYRGQDITYLDAERRLRLGITQVPGGRAVFGPMTVVENLRSFGYTLARDRRALDAAIEVCFDAFPRLAERRNQAAVTLSGGEQQMLGLSKALMLRPRLLLIDELSLGLAPVIVGQLLEMVRRINADGTAVVLVEQSVNIALGLVDHAYFMEKGEMRFDGRSEDLLARSDLLRAVFLEGAAKATGA